MCGFFVLKNTKERGFPTMELFKLFGTIAINNGEANNAIDETTGKAQGSEPKMVSAFKKIGAAVATYFAVDKIVAFGKSVVDITASFEDAMLKVQSLSGATADEYDQLSEAALHYGSTTAWTAKDVADAMGYMALAGFDTNEILASTSGMLSLASASGEELGTVTDILTDSMTGFGDSAADAGRYADVLATVQAKTNTTVGMLGEAFKYVAPLAGSYGYELEDVSTALGMMANAGVKGSIAGTSLSSIMTRLATDAGATANSLGALGTLTKVCGVEFFNSDGSARNLSDVIVELCDATKDYTVEQKADIAKTIAGQEAQKGLLAILNQGSDAYKDLNEQIRAVGESTESEAESMATNMESGVGGAIRNIQSAFEGFKISLGEKFSAPLGEAIRGVADWINSTMIPALDTMETIADDIGAFWGAVLQPAISDVGDALVAVWDALQPVIQSFSDMLPKFESNQSAMVTFKDACFEIKNALEWVAEKLQAVAQWISEHQQAVEIIATIIASVAAAVWLVNAAVTAWNVIAGIATTVTTALGAAVAFLTSPIGLAIVIITALIAIGIALYKNWDTIKAKCAEFGAAVKEKFLAMKESISQIFTAIKDKIKDIWDGIWTTIKSVINNILGGVENMVNGVVRGINVILGGLDKVVSGVGNLLGLEWNVPTLSEVSLPRLATGGVLEKGQMGLLEGDGAEAVVPLEKNREWIARVSDEMQVQGIGGGKETLDVLQKMLDVMTDLKESNAELPETLTDAIAGLKFSINNREFARLVKAV